MPLPPNVGCFVIEINDAADPRLADYRDLKDVTLRRLLEPSGGLYIAESDKVIEQALQAGHRPRSFVIARDRVSTFSGLEAWQATGAPVYGADYDVLRKLTGFHVHRGFLAAMHRPTPRTWSEIATHARRIVVLEDTVDHTNLGAIFRSIAALGWDGVLLSPRCADPLYRRSVRVSMGAVFAIPWARLEPWSGSVRDLGDLGFERLALTPDPVATDIATLTVPRDQRVALFLGTEGTGLTEQTERMCDAAVRIPMASDIDSLNIGAAAAIALWALRPA